jgi:hypothetical protein
VFFTSARVCIIIYKGFAMVEKQILSGCACCGISRRHFLAAGCAACAGAAGLALPVRRVYGAGNSSKGTLRVLFALHAETQPGPDWPNVGFEFRPVMDRLMTQLEKECGEFQYLPAMVNGAEATQAVIDEDKGKDILGYLVFQLNCWNPVAQTAATQGKPVLYVDFKYGGSGGFLVYTAHFLRTQSGNVGFVASSDPADLTAAVRCFNAVAEGAPASGFAGLVARCRQERTAARSDTACLNDPVKTLPVAEWKERIAGSKILLYQDQESADLGTYMGIPLMKRPFAELNAAWEKADREESAHLAEKWVREAKAVEGVPMEVLKQSAAMYLANKALLKEHGANAITINCLGGFYGGHIHAYPCLGFHELCNEGLVGACEGDVRSTATMTAFGILSGGRPGMISDPVIDTSKRQIIYAHCVASKRVFGPQGSDNPFTILTHSEDRQGAAVRSLLPSGYLTTTLEVNPDEKEILMHQAKAVDNDPDDRACRTKLCAEPLGDMEKLFTQWDRYGWHRVTFYGDLREAVHELADAIGYQVLEEA